jgi:FkbM family methyltransferase
MKLVHKLQYRVTRLLNRISDAVYHLPPATAGAISKARIAELVGKSNPVILEIGCNEGGDTLEFLDVFANPTIFCFEPEPRAIERFKRKVGSRPGVTLIEMALSDRTGTTTFHRSTGQRNGDSRERRPGGWDLSGSIRKPKAHLHVHPWIKFEESITVPTTTLDDWAKQQGLDLIDFIWMDVQGAERDVIHGGRRTLARTRYVYTEYGALELYEGQASLNELVRELPDFRLDTRYRGDALFAHRTLASAGA